MKLLISISLKVVSMAFVFYASLSLWAILILILDIGTLVSVRVPEIPAGALPALTYYFYGYVSFG